MRYGNYSLSIKGAKETSEGYAALRFNDEGKAPFSIVLDRYDHKRCYVEIFINDIRQGEWILSGFGGGVLSRPEHKDEGFCAYRVGQGSIGESIGAVKGDVNNGVVRAVFKPEKVSDSIGVRGSRGLGNPYEVTRGGGQVKGWGGDQTRGYSFGEATVGTEGTTGQTFQTGKSFPIESETEWVTIELRIVEDKSPTTGPSPLTPAPKGFTAPPPVG